MLQESIVFNFDFNPFKDFFFSDLKRSAIKLTLAALPNTSALSTSVSTSFSIGAPDAMENNRALSGITNGSVKYFIVVFTRKTVFDYFMSHISRVDSYSCVRADVVRHHF